MLIAARDLVRQQGVISLQEVAFKLGVPADIARAALQKWVDKGRVERLPTPAACIGCTLCDSAPRELYHWCHQDAAGGTASSSSQKGISTADDAEKRREIKTLRSIPASPGR